MIFDTTILDYFWQWTKFYNKKLVLLKINSMILGTSWFFQEFSGNTNAKEMVKNDLSRPITAHFIRFVPVEWNYKPCMRVEVYGSAIGKS